MSAESLSRPAAKLYEEDFVAWALETARLPREAIQCRYVEARQRGIESPR